MNHSDPQPGYPAPGPDPLGRPEAAAAVETGHPVLAGYDGSASSRNALRAWRGG
jgi:hypothetical protein